MRLRLLLALTLPALLVGAAVAARPLAADEDLLFNGDFGQGSEGWTPSPGLDFATDCAGYGADPGARLRLLHEEGYGNGSLVSRPVPIEPGATYEASGYARFAAEANAYPELVVGIAFHRTADGTDPEPETAFSDSLGRDAASYTPISTGHRIAPDWAHSARVRVELSASGPVTACVDDLSLVGPSASPTGTPTPTLQVPSPVPTSPPSPTTGPTGTATAIPMPVGSILNGGFEQGEEDMPAVWQKFGGLLSRSTATARSGSFSGAFSSTTSSTKWVYQPLVVEPGRSYDFHGYVLKNGPPESVVLLRISWYATADASGESLASADSPESLSGSDPSFRYLSTGSVTVPPEAHSARARIVLAPASASAETIYLDDFALEETDPPTPTPRPTETGTPMPSETATPAGSLSDGAGAGVPMARGWLLNGGFEEGEGDRPAAWQKFGGFLYRSAAVSRSGSFAGGLSSGTAATKWAYQPVIVEPGRWYDFHGFVLKNGPPESTVFLRISWYSTADASGASFASSDSLEVLSGAEPSFRYLSTGSVETPPGARSARARIMLVPASAAPEGIYMDDFAFQETLPVTPAAAEGQAEDAQAAGQSERLPGGSERQSGRFSSEPTPQGGRPRAYDDSPYAVRISEVLADPTEADGGEDTQHEWVELYNAGREAVELGGWRLVDNVAEDALPPMTFAAGAYAIVAASPEFGRQHPDLQGRVLVVTDGKIGNGLANEGDRLLLLDEEGRPVDALSYGSDREFFDPPAPVAPPGHSLERFPPDRDTDTAADFRDNPDPSPGTGPPEAPTPTATALSEVRGMALSPSAGDSAASWPWLLLAGGLVFVGGTGAGMAGVLFWLARRQRIGT